MDRLTFNLISRTPIKTNLEAVRLAQLKMWASQRKKGRLLQIKDRILSLQVTAFLHEGLKFKMKLMFQKVHRSNQDKGNQLKALISHNLRDNKRAHHPLENQQMWNHLSL